MKTRSRFVRLASFASLLALVISIGFGVAPAHAAFANFITRSGDRLLDGATPFRFMAVETFDIHYMFDNLTGQFHSSTDATTGAARPITRRSAANRNRRSGRTRR